MKVEEYSYRFAKEILQHHEHAEAWNEIYGVIKNTPLFIYPGKSTSNSRLDVVQQVMNAYYDRRLAVDLGWEYHPLATTIANSGLAADFRKQFGNVVVQVEVQFGNMSRWYSDIFKFQTAYSQRLINIGICILPTNMIANRIDSNVANYERAIREIPSAELSITLPILLAGLTADENTPIVDISQTQFDGLKSINGKGNVNNRWRIVNGYLNQVEMSEIGPNSPVGPILDPVILAAIAAGGED